ncbi:cell wall protein DAN4-like [Bombyx mandarina]|uniref:Cell wall protein DAN4-like n=1 Tax=Bombyx mandarina TaxID=7092 RepID=A0A6J2K4R9_BOMMA|nr:cell wall protein DAN4-like [Bombyx mandarina]
MATTLSTTSVTTSTTTRRPLRIANRRRPTATTRITTTPTTTTPNPITTAQPTTASPTTGQATTIEDILDVEPLQDIGDTDAIEEPNQEQRGTRKNNKVRRPLVTLKESPGDQNPSATNEEENKRQSKKYSSSFKQNQLDDLLKLKSRDLETTTEFKTTAVEDFNAETALAIAAHQLFSAPLPVSQNYDDEAKTTRTTQSFKYTSPQFNQFTDKTPYEEYPSTPTLRDTVSNVDFKQTTNPDTRITQYETTRTTDFQVTNPSINTFAGYSTLSTTSDSSELTSVYEPKSTGTLARANEETRTPSTNIRFNVPEGFTSRYTTGYTTTDFEPSLTTSFETQRPKYVPARASTFGYSTLTTENSRESTTEFETPKTGRARYRPTTTTDSSETPPGVVTVVGRGSGRYSSTPYPAITNEYLETTRGIFEDPTDFTSPKVSTFASPIPTGFTSRQRISSPSVVNAGYTGVSPRSSSRSPGSSEKYGTENYGYSTVTYSPASREPSFFTRDYLLESPVTKTYDEEYQYLTPVTTPKPRKVFRKKIQRRITTTARPTTSTTVKPSTPVRPRTTTELYEKISRAPVRTYRPIVNYDYYDDSDEKVANRYAEGTKVILHEKGTIECLDVGNFPHPTSCKKFISCARMEGETIVAWEYICPKGLSFDPVGGICNWSAGLGCDEKDV